MPLASTRARRSDAADLYVDRSLPWRELAMVMHETGDQLQGEALDREAARLRKRFERVKAELKQLAEQEGLLKS